MLLLFFSVYVKRN